MKPDSLVEQNTETDITVEQKETRDTKSSPTDIGQETDPPQVKLVPVNELTPNPWGETINPQQNAVDKNALRASIKEHGIQTPLKVWEHDGRSIVICGNTRLSIARDLGISSVPVIFETYSDEAAAKLAAIDDNLARRQLSTVQRALLALTYQEVHSVGQGARTDKQSLSGMTKVNARKMAAEIANVSEGTISNLKTIKESSNEELLRQVLSGDKSITQAAREAREATTPTKGPKRERPHYKQIDKAIDAYMKAGGGRAKLGHGGEVTGG